MKQTFRITGLDCANCASKLERRLAKLPGVTDVSLNFFTGKLSLEADENLTDSIIQTAEAFEYGIRVTRI